MGYDRDEQLIARFLKVLAIMGALFVFAALLVATEIVPDPIAGTFAPGSFNQFFAATLAGNFVAHLLCRPPRREAAAAIALAALCEIARVVWQHRAGWNTSAIVAATGFGAGAASLLAQSFFAWRTRGTERRSRLVVLLAALIIDGFVLLSHPFMSLTGPLHPLTLDPLVYAFDGTLGFQPSFAVGRLFRALPPLEHACEVVYLATALGFAIVWAAARRASRPPPIDILMAFLVASAAGAVLYHAFPVAGPGLLAGDTWPDRPPALADIGLAPRLLWPSARNCMPSLHTTWVLLMWWHSRGRGVVVRFIAAAFLLLTLLATLGNALHYAIDLVVAVPFATAIQAACARPSQERRRSLAICSSMVFAWFALLRSAVLVRVPASVLSWVLVIATVAVGLWLERRLWFASVAPAPPQPLAPRNTKDEAVPSPAMARAFFLSGAGNLIYQFVAAWTLAPAFGSTVHAALVVVAWYFVGVAAGLGFGARIDARRRDPLRIYAACAGGIAACCMALPSLLPRVPTASDWLAGRGHSQFAWSFAFRLLLAGVALLPPAMLTGLLLPVVTRHLSIRQHPIADEVNRWFVASASGAAVAAVSLAYLLLPALGVSTLVWLAVAVHLIAALLALRVHSRPDRTSPDAPDSGSPVAPTFARPPAVFPFGVGLASTALVILYAHHLLLVDANTLYAQSLTVACFLSALAGGAALMRLALRKGAGAASSVAIALSLLAAIAVADVALWQLLPEYFASFEHYALAPTFGAREVVRGFVIALLLAPPALCLGASHSAITEWATRSAPRPSTAIARLAAWRWTGGLLGLLAAGALLSRSGSLSALGPPSSHQPMPAWVRVPEAQRTLFVGVDSEVLGRSDGRSQLMRSGHSYDLVVVEPPSLLVDGASSYNREFYELAAGALSQHGELRERLPLERVSPLDLSSVLASAHAIFPRVWLYLEGPGKLEAAEPGGRRGTRAVLIACASDCAPPAEPLPLLLLDTEGIERLLADACRIVGGSPSELISTDDNLFLEYHAPRSAVRPAGPTLEMNVQWLRSFSAH